MLHTLLLVALPAQLGAALPEDSIDRLRSRARAAEATYERLSRNLAPFSWGGSAGRDCDEIVGRFCLRFDASPGPPPEGEVGRVVDARRDAVEAIRRYFSAAPGELSAAGPLVRLLVQDERSREALSAARAFAALSEDTLWADLLLGLANHASGDIEEAERRFVRALGRMEPERQRAWADPEWLLDHAERRSVRRLSSRDRAEYERKFWLVSDPFWLTPANESWVEHMTRHVESRLLERVPIVGGMLRWGSDLDELTIRYGTPVARGRIGGSRDESSLVEYFDTAQRAFAPAAWLSAGLPGPPRPDRPPLLYASRVRSAHVVRAVTRVLDLPHQLTRFIEGDSVVLRVDAAVPPRDSLPSSVLDAGLFAYDSAFTRRFGTRDQAVWRPDTLPLTLLVTLPPGRLVYSIEVMDTAADFAARARYAVDALVPDDGPVLSDLLLSQPFRDGGLPERRDDPQLVALPRAVVNAGDTLGIYAEVQRIAGTTAAIRIGIEPADGPNALARAARWIGRTLGLTGPPTDPTVEWRAPTSGGIHPIALDLPLDADRRGTFALVLRVTDPVTGRTSESRRLLLIR